VDEENVALAQRGQDRGHVSLAFQRRARGRAQGDAELLTDDVREARLAEAGRPDQQQVVERLAARARGLERDRELLLDPLLADELVEPTRPKRALELVVVGLDRRCEELRLGHAASRSASRTCSSIGSSASTLARARSASTGV